MTTPGTRLQLSTKDSATLGRFLLEILDELEAEHRPYFERIDTWWDWYEAKPLTPHRDFPWEGASNVVLPFIRTWSDALISRHFTRIFAAPKIWVAQTQNEDIRNNLQPWMDYLNWAAKGNVFDLFVPVWNWISEMIPIGSSVLALNWQNRSALRYLPGTRNRTQEVTISRGPLVEHVPREQMLWRVGTNLQDSDVVARQFWMTRREVIHRGAQGDWDNIQNALDAPDRNTPHESRDRANERAGFGSATNQPMWDVREVWIDYPTLKAGGLAKVVRPEEAPEGREGAPIVVTLHRTTGKVLRAIQHPYFFTHWPFYDVHYRKRSGRSDSAGVAQMAEHLQRAATTIVNQSIDAVTLANSINFFTTDRRFLDWKFAPNRPVVVSDMNAVREAQLSKQVVPDINLINLMLSAGERLFSVTDPALGRETRLGGRPSPATSTLLMLEQLELNIGTTQRFLRHQLSRLAEDISTLFQQFETNEDGRIEAALGAEDAGVVTDLILPLDQPISGNVRFDLHAFSETNNPEAERQKAVLIDQMLTNYYAQLLQLGQVLASEAGQDPFIRQTAIFAMQGKSITMRRFLEASDFDEIEQVLVQTQELTNANALNQQLAAIQQHLAGQAQAAAGTLQLGGLGAPTGGPNGGTAPPFGGPGSGL